MRRDFVLCESGSDHDGKLVRGRHSIRLQWSHGHVHLSVPGTKVRILRDYTVESSANLTICIAELVHSPFLPPAPYVHKARPVGHNAGMRTQVDMRDAVDHLPEAAVLVLDDITWEEYEQISEQLQERPNIRLTFDQGRLEIVTTSRVHEFWKETVLRLVHSLCEELNRDMESYGGATWERKRQVRAVEADTCFYIDKARQVIGKEDIRLERNDPPPDVVVEVDKSNQSRSKFPIYAAIQVPEIWQCDVRRNVVRIFQLRQAVHHEAAASRFFPMLSGDVLVKFVLLARRDGQTAAVTAFRGWIRSQL
jgi:Uma2 family endonuclease